jgi:hypothetical protein
MRKKDRIIEATIVLDIRFFIDETTEPEDVLNRSNLYVNSDHAMITEMKFIHSAITKDEKVKI